MMRLLIGVGLALLGMGLVAVVAYAYGYVEERLDARRARRRTRGTGR